MKSLIEGNFDQREFMGLVHKELLLLDAALETILFHFF